MTYGEFCKGLRSLVEKVTIKGYVGEKEREVNYFCRSGTLEKYAETAGVAIKIYDKSYVGMFKSICFVHNGCDDIEFARLVDEEEVIKPRRLGIWFKHEFDEVFNFGTLIWNMELQEAVISLHMNLLATRMHVKISEFDTIKEKLDGIAADIEKLKKNISMCEIERDALKKQGMITIDMINAGLDKGIIRITDNAEDFGCMGIACQIGDNAFYFDEDVNNNFETAKDYLSSTPTDVIAASILQALNEDGGLRTEFPDEYAYYRTILQDQIALSSEQARAKALINDFCKKEYGNYADFSDLSNVDIAYTVLTNEADGKDYPIQVSVDLVKNNIRFTLNDQIISQNCYDTLSDLIEKELKYLDFNELTYVSDEDWKKFNEM